MAEKKASRLKRPRKRKPKRNRKRKSAAAKAKAKKARQIESRSEKSRLAKSTAKASPKKLRQKVGSSAPTSGLDKSVAQFRESLEQSVTLSRDRIQEVVDDAVNAAG